MRAPRSAPPLFMLLFVSMFGFIGLTVLVSLWSAEGFHEPPLVFKLFGSFIALAFIFVGFGMPLSALMGRGQNSGDPDVVESGARTAPAGGYKCPNCGAGIGTQEVSPSGDVKCGYCHRWYNIHANG